MTSTDRLKNYLQQLCPFPEKDWEIFSTRLSLRTLPKKAILLKPGMTEDYVSFIERGIVRYFVEEREREITFEIAFEGSLAAAYDSFLTRTPVGYFAEALSDVELWSIRYADLQAAYAETQMGDRLGRLAAEQLYLRKSTRQMALLRNTAEQRYRTMVQLHSHFIQQVPLKYLASYIGVTPQALSRIRARIAAGE